MLKIKLPEDKDASTLHRLCTDPVWAPHKGTWEKAYVFYWLFDGDPWRLAPAVFRPDVADKQRRLYDTRKQGGPIRRIRDTPGLTCCPMCGSQATGSVDHYLPRADYPEFSIFSPNLVPACVNCNSGRKGSIVKEPPAARFLHPYFDAVLDEPIWRVRLIQPFGGARFQPEPMPNLTANDAALVTFHLKHVLGTQYKLWTATQWANLPQQICDRLERLAVIDAGDVKAEVLSLLRGEMSSRRHNSWLAALLRGIASDSDALSHIAGLATALVAAPFPDPPI